MTKLLSPDTLAMNQGRMPLVKLFDRYGHGIPVEFRTACLQAMFDPRLTAGDIGDYDTGTLLEVLYAPPQVPGIVGFWLNYFDRTINSETEEIRFDSVDLNEFRLAPFVIPTKQGVVMRGTGYEVKSFKPAYIKVKHVVDPTRAIPRQAGEQPFGSLSLQERFDAIVADNLRRERAVIENRWDWMACKAMVDSQITISGDDYPTTTINFGRDPSLTYTLAGAALWSQTTAAPMTDIQNARRNSFTLSRSPIVQLVFGLDAWDAFLLSSHADVQVLLDEFRKGNQAIFNTVSGLSSGSPYEYQGQIAGFAGGGRLDLWTYNNEFSSRNPDGTYEFTSYLDQGTVVGIGSNYKGIRCFGAILDRGAQMQALDMFPKQWDEQDPSVSYTMTQSAPLMVPLRPNNTFSLKVV